MPKRLALKDLKYVLFELDLPLKRWFQFFFEAIVWNLMIYSTLKDFIEFVLCYI